MNEKERVAVGSVAASAGLHSDAADNPIRDLLDAPATFTATAAAVIAFAIFGPVTFRVPGAQCVRRIVSTALAAAMLRREIIRGK